MYETIDRPRYVIPGLAGIYAGLETYSWLMIRVATGLFFVPHGMQKLFGFWGGDLAKTAEGFGKLGLEPGMFWASYIGCLELVGGPLLAIGLLTRPIAALFVGFMAVGAFHVHMKIGWVWTPRGMGGPPYLMLVCLAVLIPGRGAWCGDPALRRESW